MKLAIILGTRPEVIKLSSVIRYCKKNNINFFVIHTNQHYSKNMDEIFFQELELPKPKYNLNIGSASHGKQIGKMLEKVEKILIFEKPTHVLVQGDTNTVLAGALAASKLNIKIIHLEAGLRSYDRIMPEEINRVIVDSIGDILLCPTKNQEKILLKEGVNKEKIFVTGNTIVDAIIENKKLFKQKSKILEKLSLKRGEYFLLTMHRPSNVDKKENLENIFHGIKKVFDYSGKIFIFSIHPRTQKTIKRFNVKVPSFIKIIPPIGYLDMLNLLNNSKMVFTDSGGLQEEACILRVPTLTLRENTERPETIQVGANILVGSDKKKIFEGYKILNKRKNNWKNPFGRNVTNKIFKIFKIRN